MNESLCDHLMASGTRHKKRIPSISIGERDISANRDKKVKEGDVSCPTCDQKRGEAVSISTIDVGSSGEEDLFDQLEMSLTTRFCQTRFWAV